MKKYMIGCCLLFMLLMIDFEYIRAEEPLTTEGLKETYIDEWMKGKEMGDINRLLRELLPDSKITFQEMVESIINSEGQVSVERIEIYLKQLVMGIVDENRSVLLYLFVLSLISILFLRFAEVFQNKQISDMGFYVSYLLVFTVCLKTFGETMQLVEGSLNKMIIFMKCFSPIYFIGMSVTVGSMSTIAFYNIVIFLIYVVEVIIFKMILPIVYIYMILQILNYLSEEDMLSKCSDFINFIVNGALRILLIFVTSLNFMESILNPAIDTVRRNSIVKGIEMIPGIGNIAEGAGELILGVAVLVKNGIGLAGTMILLAICIVPLANLVVVIVLYKSLSAVMQPVAEKRYVEMMESMSEGYLMLFKILGVSLLLFFITIAVAVKAVR